MKIFLLLPILGLAAACRSSSDGFTNGLSYAEVGDVVEDVEGQTMTVRLARYETDKTTGVTSLIVTDETVTFDVDGIGNSSLAMTISGEDVVVVIGDGDFGGQTLYFYEREYSGVFSSIYTFYVYGDIDAVDTQGFFAFGLETNPETIEAATGSAQYVGEFSGYGALLDVDGVLIEEEYEHDAEITLTADFDTNLVSGDLDGSAGGIAYTGTFTEAGINGSGFDTTFDVACTDCLASSGGTLEGMFYGDAAQELSGSGTLTIETTGDGYVGAGGFVALEQP